MEKIRNSRRLQRFMLTALLGGTLGVYGGLSCGGGTSEIAITAFFLTATQEGQVVAEKNFQCTTLVLNSQGEEVASSQQAIQQVPVDPADNPPNEYSVNLHLNGAFPTQGEKNFTAEVTCQVENSSPLDVLKTFSCQKAFDMATCGENCQLECRLSQVIEGGAINAETSCVVLEPIQATLAASCIAGFNREVTCGTAIFIAATAVCDFLPVPLENNGNGDGDGGGDICGDGTCDPNFERTDTCPQDCRCGDGVCDEFEDTEASCVADCGGGDSGCKGSPNDLCTPPFESSGNCSDCFCGDGVCDGVEDGNETCPDDCEVSASCGDGICEGDIEDHHDCPDDCFCGDGVCDHSEEEFNECPHDCGGSNGICGNGVIDSCECVSVESSLPENLCGPGQGCLCEEDCFIPCAAPGGDCCGDGICNPGEGDTCPESGDCPSSFGVICRAPAGPSCVEAGCNCQAYYAAQGAAPDNDSICLDETCCTPPVAECGNDFHDAHVGEECDFFPGKLGPEPVGCGEGETCIPAGQPNECTCILEGGK